MNRKVNYKGEWMEIDVSDEEVEQIRNKSIEESKEIASKIMAMTNKWPVEIQAVLIQQATQHFIFKLDEVVIEQVKAERKAEREARK